MRVEMHSRSVPSDVLSFGTADKDSMDAPLLNPVGEDSPRRHLKSPHFVIPSLVGAVSCALLFCTGMVMTGRPYAEPCVGYQYTVCQYTGCYTVGQFFGTLFAIVAIPPALLALGWLPQALVSRYRNAGQDLGGTLLSLKMCALILSVCVLLVWVFILKPWAIFPNAAGTAGGYGHGFNRYGIIELYFGGYLAVLLPILIAVYWLVWHHLSNKLDRDDGLHNHAARRLEPPAFQCGKLSLLLAVLVAAFLATMAFSPVINYSPQSYFPSTSTYSLLSISLGPHFTSKLYEDAVVYYCFLCGLACLGAAGHSSYKVRRVLHTRLRVPGDPSSSFHPFPHGISVGEIGLLLAGAALYAYWLYFWRWNYARIQTEAALGANPLYQVWARVLGHMTNLSFSLLLLPAARNSMWVSCFGVPFERAVKYHRGLGCVAYLCVTAHMLVWFVKWGMEGNLLNNMFNVHELRLSPTSWTNKATCSGEYPHWDNFTVPMVWIGWVALTAMVCLALLCRRRNYELFHYAHHFAWVYYIIALLHAWSFWYYASGGLMLYAIDRAIRLKRACTSTAIVSLDNIDGVTHFTFPHSLLHHYAGQYAFVNIPALSELEWHPFTISSPPDASEVTFHIKAMGPGTWTERLSLLAMHPIMTEVRVDGPYGKPGDFSDKSVILLIAGGIGITPMHAIFAELHAQACKGSSALRHLRAVHLIWAGRSDSMFLLFAKTFLEVSKNNPGSIFHVDLYNSMPPMLVERSFSDISQDAVDHTRARIQRGRPKLRELFASVREPASDVMVMACGPEALILDASDHAFTHGFAFHTEVFHF